MGSAAAHTPTAEGRQQTGGGVRTPTDLPLPPVPTPGGLSPELPGEQGRAVQLGGS